MKIVKSGQANEWHASKFDRFLYWYSTIVTPIIAYYAIISDDETGTSALVWIAFAVVAVMTLLGIIKTEYTATKGLQKFGYCIAWFTFVTTMIGVLTAIIETF